MIDIKNGKVIFAGQNDALYSGMMKSDFLTSSLYRLIQKDNSHQTASIYDLVPQMIFDRTFKIFIIFDQNNKLFIVQMYSINADVQSWDDWSEDRAMKEKENNDNFLIQNIGDPPYYFSWGEIGSQYDPRSGSSNITIRYI